MNLRPLVFVPLVFGPLVFALALAASPRTVQAQAGVGTPAPLVTPAAVTLRYKFAVGQVRRYKMVMDTNMTILTGQSGAGVPINSHMETTMRQTVKDVRASDGAATVEVVMDSYAMTANGSPVHLPAAQEAQMKKPSTLTMTPSGKILAYHFGNLPSGGVPGMDFSKGLISGNYALPENPVQVGQSWSATAASGMVGMEMAIKSTLTGLETGDGTQSIADISQKISGVMNLQMAKSLPMKMTGHITGTGTQRFDTLAGAIAGQDMTMQAAMTMNLGNLGSADTQAAVPHSMRMKMQMHQTMTRIDDAPPAAATPGG